MKTSLIVRRLNESTSIYIFLPSYPAWTDSQMCVGVWVGQGQSLSEETASFLGTPDNFPSEPPGYCADSLTNTGNVNSIDKIPVSFRFIKWLPAAMHVSVQLLNKSLEMYLHWICLTCFKLGFFLHMCVKFSYKSISKSPMTILRLLLIVKLLFLLPLDIWVLLSSGQWAGQKYSKHLHL